MNTDKLIKELELLADSYESNYALEVNGYSRGVNDAIDLVKKLTTPVVRHSCEMLPSFLYKSDDGLYFKHRENTDVTEQWNEYLKTK